MGAELLITETGRSGCDRAACFGQVEVLSDQEWKGQGRSREPYEKIWSGLFSSDGRGASGTYAGVRISGSRTDMDVLYAGRVYGG